MERGFGKLVAARLAFSVAATAAALALTGCPGSKARQADHFVYVTAKQTYLRDRVAAVSNRTGTVNNGDKLTVLEHARRFVRVRTEKGEVGWIDEKAVATETAYDQFADLGRKHENDKPVASATVRDEVYLHIAPGRETDRFFRLAEGDKLSLLGRSTVEKATPPGGVKAPAAVPVATPAAKPASGKGAASPPPVAPDAPPPPSLEDWWLVRDAKGDTGWIYSHMIDVDAPETLARYAEGQRVVGAYVLTHVNDPESGVLKDGQVDPDVPVYVTVLSPYRAGLPYDFNQVRVFTWNLKKHRYETAFRQHDVMGYLPVTIKMVTDPYSKAQNASTPLPGFTVRVLAAGQPVPQADPTTGLVSAKGLIEKTYRLEGNIMRRIVPPGPVPDEAHPDPEPSKKDAKKKRK